MGLVHTKTYLDFPSDEWKQVSNDPATFEAKSNGISLDIMDDGYKNIKLTFKKGGRIQLRRTVGKYRVSWNDSDVS